MFMVNFRVGMMSVANNIPMVLQGLCRQKQPQKLQETPIRTALVARLPDPAGLCLLLMVLCFLLQIQPGLFDETHQAFATQKEKSTN
jgi:hypothetical protein